MKTILAISGMLLLAGCASEPQCAATDYACQQQQQERAAKMMEFGLRLMQSSQPQPNGAIVGPTFGGAVGNAGLGTFYGQ